MVQAVQKCGCLVERTQNNERNRTSRRRRKRKCGDEITLVSELHFHKTVSRLARRWKLHPRQFAPLLRRQSAAHDRLSPEKCSFVSGNFPKRLRNLRVHFVAENQNSNRSLCWKLPEFDWLQLHFVKSAARKPPIVRLAFGKSSIQQFLRVVQIKPRIARLNRGNSARPIRQNECFGATLLQQVSGPVLDGGEILGRHKRADGGEVGDELGGMFQGLLTLEFEGPQCMDGGAQIGTGRFADTVLDSMADNERSSARQTSRKDE